MFILHFSIDNQNILHYVNLFNLFYLKHLIFLLMLIKHFHSVKTLANLI